MAVVLGIHNGHHASCAVVRDGVLVAAIQQERLTRVKNDGQEGLSNRLPVRECLRAARVSLDEVNVIVSSFQAASPGGVGLHRPLVERGFDLFDPRDPRHLVTSHHHAHGLSALGTSGWTDAAVLVCDLAGSTTRDGADFTLPFIEFERQLCSMAGAVEMRTECLSIYEADATSFTLRHREYCVPHNAPDVFVQNAASLYDNVARMIFGIEHAHGQLMALASMAPDGAASSAVQADDIVEVDPGGGARFRNDWQHRVRRHSRVLDHAPLATAVQSALQSALLAYVRNARVMTSSPRLAAAGGVFLNIPANSEILQSGLFEDYYVPSAPHDAGISIGCAYTGWRRIAGRSTITVGYRVVDRLGPTYDSRQVDQALHRHADADGEVGSVSPSTVAQLLQAGQVLARCAGRSEFGPRALGGRSLLASPLLPETKNRLNAIKRRQPWRPVAPIVPRDRLHEFFDGPCDTPYMNFLHLVRQEHRDALVALRHPDGSTRVQTLNPSEDTYLSAVLDEFGRLTGFPILTNTSLNGPGEPIVETPQDALNFFTAHPDVDALLLEDRLFRRARASGKQLRLAPDTIVTIVYPLGTKRIIMLRRGESLEISQHALDLIECQLGLAASDANRRDHGLVGDQVEKELLEALRRGLLMAAPPS